MEVTVSGRKTTVSQSLRNQAEEKIGRLEKYLEMDRAEVHFWEQKNSRSKDTEFCEVTLEGHGHHIRCKVSAPDGFTAIDLAVAKLERQLRKLKTKVNKRYRGRERPDIPPELVPERLVSDDDAVEPMYNIVKSKLFEINSLDPQGAALQMDLLNHDFYLFTNAETERAAVVYRRDDGNVGLIEVE